MPRKRSRPPVHADAAPAADQHPDALTAFRARLTTGDFNQVLGRRLRLALHDAARDTSLEIEVGALRLALSRLLKEETDPTRLAAGVSRLTAVAVQAARLRNGPDTEFDEMRTLMLRELDVVEAEYAEEMRRHRESEQLPPWSGADPAPWQSHDPSPVHIVEASFHQDGTSDISHAAAEGAPPPEGAAASPPRGTMP